MFRKSINPNVVNLPQYQVSSSNAVNNSFEVFSSGNFQNDLYNFGNRADNWANSWGPGLGQAIASLNPIVGLVNGYKGYTSGTDYFGEDRTKLGSSFEMGLSIIPFGIEIKELGAAAKGGGRVFWSGGNVAKTAAADFAKANGMKTLEMTTSGRVMNSISPYLPRSVSGPIWNTLSSNFAKGASGNINVFQNAAGVSLNSTWRLVEYPLLKNQNIIFNIVK